MVRLLWPSASRVPQSAAHSDDLSCFALCTPLACALVERDIHDYYHDSVTLGLAPRRPSHVPSPRNGSSAT